ncbi:MAG: D-glycero-beta-D-manno-heptose 1-phosphate adenylyltransferase [Anaerolineales bacterium]|nr:D-glycero-beta-D-manno-heptose 1-phosphate adenylyltransferase [Anaerolineales bacterium]
MNQNLLHFINSFSLQDVVVLGEAMLDSYLHGHSNRLCREAPVPVVSISEWEDVPGGAANTAVNVHTLGGHVRFLSVIGQDQEGQRLRQALETRGVSSDDLLAHPARRTLSKNRVLAGSQITVRFDQGSTEPLDPDYEARLCLRLQVLWSDCDAVIVSDYGYGILTPRLIRTLAELQQQSPRLLTVDAKELNQYRDVGITAVKPNYHECLRLLDGAVPLEGAARVGQISAHSEKILELTGAQITAVTLDHDGAIFLEQDRPGYRTYTRPQPDSHAAGAGDTFLSALTLALAAAAPTHSAAEIAAAAASIVVAENGTTTCTAEMLRGTIAAADKYVPDLEALVDRLSVYRQYGSRIVFTNGCFDILHRGHITYLNQAKALGDVLIVGVNGDESVRRLKGDHRPINTLADRVQVLDALSCIDHIVPFHEDTPARLIEAIRPHIFVKGGDYTRETLPEASLVEALGGEVHILPYLEDISTTNLISRIRERFSASTAVVL